MICRDESLNADAKAKAKAKAKSMKYLISHKKQSHVITRLCYS
ncbi:hypothetical protein SL69_00400 [Klebsiella pneumoniae]|uniref:Uncharacterized protein n=1 Tax=Klebsiella pneumoniae TaxID=573 RepID=A0A378A963_KLEPN|nr:hypothetical protein KPN2242_19655 [Klebsiella pneumoniae KCTC 2242]EJK90426.1 hypothetical protein UUU_35460 [Klebsiella pneumoniae subsp. pneumoniae DSM 30104 = JCM 1662 = NBRC 14940]KFJ76429.1 hypothetical protein DR88_2485 [Klebsiella pneumoniae]CCN31449.1 hypothetical protein BN373_39691 [Klebsiella pneumoniae subsp. pneumoniae Ecl8]SQC83178.1 Uncharacterised protein [Klebsiella pneumoniae subsp. pneumoniae]